MQIEDFAAPAHKFLTAAARGRARRPSAHQRSCADCYGRHRHTDRKTDRHIHNWGGWGNAGARLAPAAPPAPPTITAARHDAAAGPSAHQRSGTDCTGTQTERQTDVYITGAAGGTRGPGWPPRLPLRPPPQWYESGHTQANPQDRLRDRHDQSSPLS